MQSNSNGHVASDEEAEAEKARLLADLESVRKATVAALRGVDDFAVIHPETGWRLMDILGHLAAWEHEVFAALQAFTENDEYSIPDFDLQRYNTDAYERRRDLDPAQIRIDWAMVRGDIRLTLRDMSTEQLRATMRYPSGRQGTAAALIQELLDHEAEHLQDILASQTLNDNG